MIENQDNKQKPKEGKKNNGQKDNKKNYLGWIALVLVFVFKFFPWNIFASIILSIIVFTQKDHNNTVAIISLVFAFAFLFIFTALFFIV